MSQLWIWLIVSISVFFHGMGLTSKLLLGKPFGDYGNRNPGLLFLAFLYFSWGMN